MVFAGVLPEVPSFGASLARNLGAGLSHGLGTASEFAAKMAIQKERHKADNKEVKKTLQQTFTPILEEMKSYSKDVGPTTGIFDFLNPWSEGAGKRSRINTSRLTLEGLFRDLTLKGQFPKAIYERILKELPSATDSESQYTNKIEAIEKILEAQLGGESSAESSENALTKEKFSSENPEHRKKAEQLYKTHKDKKKVLEDLKREFKF